jgi:DNA-binding response OmpR family regulator
LVDHAAQDDCGMTESAAPGVVVVAEDDPDLGAFLQAALQRRSGLTVRLVENGRDALSVMSEELVDVLVTDIQMPGMTGMELVREVRNTQPALPIIMMTAHASLDYAVEALRHQVDEFLVKPIAAAELVPKVKALALRGAAARQTARALGAIDPAAHDPADVTRLERQMLLDLATVMGQQTSLSQQLERAAQVQQDLLPRQSPVLSGYEMAGACVPSFAIGGDFFDWYVAEDCVEFTVADVMGKGIPAAIVTATVRAVMRGVERGRGPVVALQTAAVALLYDLEKTGTFVTVFHARLQGSTGQLSYADAGHGMTLLVHPDGRFERLGSEGMPLGVDRDSEWCEKTATVEPGDWVVSFSDGLFDLLGGTSAAFTDIATLVSTSTTPAEAVDRIRAVAATEVLIDDVTVVVLHRLVDSQAGTHTVPDVTEK